MNLFARLFSRRDPREEWRALWHEVVRVSRERQWYADCGVADTVEGRFDMISMVLALVLLRMEGEEALAPATAYMTELFVEDMDRQLRETGVGDLMVGKHMGRLLSVLGGRLGALRQALAGGDDTMLAQVLERNVALAGQGPPQALAARLRLLQAELAAAPAHALASGCWRG